MKESLRGMALFLALALVVGACSGTTEPATTASGGETESTEGGQTDTTPASETPSSTAAEQGGGEYPDADRDGVITVGSSLSTPSMSGTFDPIKSTSGCDVYIPRQIFGSLIGLDHDWNPRPFLVESWDFVDDLTTDLHLFEGITFHNGDPFDAEAVKYGLDRNRAEGSAHEAALNFIDEVEVVDDLTVRIHTSRPAAGSLLTTLAGREGMIVSEVSVDDGSIDDNPIAAGPYTIEEWLPGQSLKLRRYEGYFDQDAFLLGGIDFVQVDDQVSARNALLAGDIDMGYIDLEGVQPLESNPNTQVFVDPAGPGNFGMYVNLNTSLEDPPLDNQLVREALNHAVDREALATAVVGENGVPKYQLFAPGTIGHDPALDNYYPYDPERARELLAEAGYPDGFSMTMMAFPSPEPSRAAEIVQSNLADIGVDLQLELGFNMTQDYHIDRNFDAGQNLWVPRTDPTLTLLTLYGPVGVLNASEYNNPDLNEFVYDIQGRTDRDAIDQGLQEASRVIIEEAREIGLAYLPATWGYSDRVAVKDGGLHQYGNACSGLEFSSIYVKEGS